MGYFGENDAKIDSVKKISVDMLADFDKFCKEHDLTYFIAYGTCLGALRHGGFIPWDDDVDVSMPASDYLKLKRLWLKHGDKEKYFLQTKGTDPYILYPFYRIRLNGTTWIDADCDNIPIHWGIPIDVFPVYNSPNNRHLAKLLHKINRRSAEYCKFAWENPEASGSKKAIYHILTDIMLFLCFFISSLSFRSKDVYYTLSSYNDCAHGAKDICLPAKPIKFETVVLMGPNRPEKYCEWQYGDYMKMPPEEMRQGHSIGILDLENDSEKYTGVKRRNK